MAGRAAVGLALVAGIAVACSSHSPASETGEPGGVGPSPLPPARNAVWPNEPAGLRVLTDWGLDDPVPTTGDTSIPGSAGWKVAYESPPGPDRGWAERTADPTARLSPPGVYDFVFPEGMVEGRSPATVY